MKRKDFLKRLGLITGAAIAAPMLASEILKEEGSKVTIVATDEMVYEINQNQPYTITLPPPQNGMKFTFIGTTDWKITPSGNETITITKH